MESASSCDDEEEAKVLEPKKMLDSDDEDQSFALPPEHSDIFDTDSSDEAVRESLGSGDELGNLESDVVLTRERKPAEVTDEEEKPREEMGGTLVYDSYCKPKGNSKLERYFQENPPQRVSTDILFSKTEQKEAMKDIFGEKARERDFKCDSDKMFYRNLPRFQTQRDFSNLQATLLIPDIQNVLIFDSRFENGNLRKVAKVSNIEYNLWLENDLNTRGHTQWYFFKVMHQDIVLAADKKAHRVKFNILNLAKTSSLYQTGMKPCIWSRNKF